MQIRVSERSKLEIDRQGFRVFDNRQTTLVKQCCPGRRSCGRGPAVTVPTDLKLENRPPCPGPAAPTVGAGPVGPGQLLLIPVIMMMAHSESVMGTCCTLTLTRLRLSEPRSDSESAGLIRRRGRYSASYHDWSLLLPPPCPAGPGLCRRSG